MEINISGHQVEVGKALQDYAKEKTRALVTKYFAHAIDAHIIFEKRKACFHAEIKVHERTQKYAIADSEDSDIYKAFDDALHKIESQLRKYKAKLVDKHNKE